VSSEQSHTPCFEQLGAAGTPAGSCSSSSLEPLESKRQQPGEYLRFSRYGSPEHDIQPITPEESTFRHSGWAARRAQIFRAFETTGVSEARRSSFANCGSGLWLETNADGSDIHLACNKCHDRWCIPCGTERGGLIREKLNQHLAGRIVKMLTLTLRHSNTPLTDQIDRLLLSFNRLKHRSAWKNHVAGGVAFMELKIGEKDHCWHVHLHILLEASFWEQREISQEWHAVTGDSCIIHITKIADSEHASHYVTKYITKPADSSVFANPAKLQELVISLRGRKLIMPFGTWRSMKLSEKPEATDDWKPVQQVHVLQSRAREGDVESIRWLEAAIRKWPLFASTFGFG
jgi:hypothetical protein